MPESLAENKTGRILPRSHSIQYRAVGSGSLSSISNRASRGFPGRYAASGARSPGPQNPHHRPRRRRRHGMLSGGDDREIRSASVLQSVIDPFDRAPDQITAWSAGWTTKLVAQSCTLPYRRIVFCGASPSPGMLGLAGALPIGNRRYSRLKICIATVLRSICRQSHGLHSKLGALRRSSIDVDTSEDSILGGFNLFVALCGENWLRSHRLVISQELLPLHPAPFPV